MDLTPRARVALAPFLQSPGLGKAQRCRVLGGEARTQTLSVSLLKPPRVSGAESGAAAASLHPSIAFFMESFGLPNSPRTFPETSHVEIS